MAFTPLPNMSDEDGFAPGVVPSLVFAFRFNPTTGLLQFRVGDFPDANTGWQDVVGGSAALDLNALLAAAEQAKDDAEAAAASITSPLPLTSGGTGAEDAATARTNLGANDADNLTAGTVADARLPTSQAGKTFTTPPVVPSLTTAERDALVSPAIGSLIYNTTLNQFEGRADGAWVRVGSLNQGFQ